MAGVTGRWRPDAAQLRRAVGVLLLHWLALGITIALVPGISAHATWDVLLAAVLLGTVGASLRPLIAATAVRLGWFGVFVGFLFSNALLGYLVLWITPGITVDGFWPAFWASWLFAVLVSIALWLVTAGDHNAILHQLLRTTRRVKATTPTTQPGVVFIQIDGLAAPLLRWAVQAGNLPTLSRWIRSGSHTMTEWHAQLPATTPASQAGLLHGASGQVPAFRWYEKDPGRLVVTSRPKDSALVEQRLSNGRGLLADDGVSLSNVFSGDAPTSLLTMSTAGPNRNHGGPTRDLGAYLLDGYGLTRSLVITVGEMIKEVYQARLQRLQNIEPRGHRPFTYVVLRAVTNVLLRDLNLYLLAEHMMRGAPSLYSDFVGYDEVAHHAGPVRAESLASLKGIDQVLGTLEQLAANASRPYHFVVLSDHGQSQGATFKQRYGVRLDDLVRQLMTGPAAVAATDEDEQQGRARPAIRACCPASPPTPASDSSWCGPSGTAPSCSVPPVCTILTAAESRATTRSRGSGRTPRQTFAATTASRTWATSSSSAGWTTPPTRSRRSRSWSAATAASVAGRAGRSWSIPATGRSRTHWTVRTRCTINSSSGWNGSGNGRTFDRTRRTTSRPPPRAMR
jgi:uncharacterized membrane protein YvlD (DUF360 family)